MYHFLHKLLFFQAFFFLKIFFLPYFFFFFAPFDIKTPVSILVDFRSLLLAYENKKFH